MQKGDLNKDQAIAIVGEEAVNKIEHAVAEPTGRVGFNGACQGDDSTEWIAVQKCKTVSGDDAYLYAYYYTSNKQDENLDSVNWKIAGYQVLVC